jgi:hypothetical protein
MAHPHLVMRELLGEVCGGVHLVGRYVARHAADRFE